MKLSYKLGEDEIEKYETKYITQKLKNRETDIVYKLKDRNVFFLIEHQSKIDYSMPYRIAEYQMEIIDSVINKKKIKNKSYKIPLVIPIVSYTGRRKWNANKYIKDSMECLEEYNREELSKYSLIDVNDYTEKELLNSKSLVTKMMLLESSKDKESIEKNLEEIVTIGRSSKENIDLLINIVGVVLTDIIGENKANKYINILIERRDEKMLNCVRIMKEAYKKERADGRKEGLATGRKEGLTTGKKEGIETGKTRTILKIKKNMEKKGFSLQEISEITGISEKELKEVKV